MINFDGFHWMEYSKWSYSLLSRAIDFFEIYYAKHIRIRILHRLKSRNSISK